MRLKQCAVAFSGPPVLDRDYSKIAMDIKTQVITAVKQSFLPPFNLEKRDYIKNICQGINPEESLDKQHEKQLELAVNEVLKQHLRQAINSTILEGSLTQRESVNLRAYICFSHECLKEILQTISPYYSF